MNPTKSSLPVSSNSMMQNLWTPRTMVSNDPNSLLAHLHRGELYRMERERRSLPQQQHLALQGSAAPDSLILQRLSLEDLRDVIQQAASILDGSDESGSSTECTGTGTAAGATRPSRSYHQSNDDVPRRRSSPRSQ